MEAVKVNLIKSLHSKLHNNIDSYETIARDRMEANEKDFLCAYKSHMRKVFKDLEKIRRKISELESATYRDERV
jgi:hypothetical protein